MYVYVSFSACVTFSIVCCLCLAKKEGLGKEATKPTMCKDCPFGAEQNVCLTSRWYIHSETRLVTGAYLLGLMAKIMCSICSNQCEN